MVYLCGNFPNGGTAVAEADDLTDPDHMISSVEKLISAGCNMITICPCNDTMLIKVAKLCEENKVYWAVAWRDILDPGYVMLYTHLPTSAAPQFSPT